MNIPISTLLQKMHGQINEATTASNAAEIREKIAAIKTLCDVILEQENSVAPTVPVAQLTQQKNVVPPQVERTSVMSSEPKPAKMNEANGESLFDF